MGHFADSLPGLPDRAKAYFRRFRNIAQTWADAKHGVNMAWLARVVASSPADEAQLKSALADAKQKLEAGIQAFYRTNKAMSKDDVNALPLAHRVVLDEIAVIEGELDEKKVAEVPSPPPPEYDAFRAQALEQVADIMRSRLDVPEP